MSTYEQRDRLDSNFFEAKEKYRKAKSALLAYQTALLSETGDIIDKDFKEWKKCFKKKPDFDAESVFTLFFDASKYLPSPKEWEIRKVPAEEFWSAQGYFSNIHKQKRIRMGFGGPSVVNILPSSIALKRLLLYGVQFSIEPYLSYTEDQMHVMVSLPPVGLDRASASLFKYKDEEFNMEIDEQVEDLFQKIGPEKFFHDCYFRNKIKKASMQRATKKYTEYNDSLKSVMNFVGAHDEEIFENE